MYWWKFYATATNIKDAVSCGESKSVLVGGIGEINFGKQFRQGNRIYSADHIAMALTAQPLGNTGGYSYLYLVRNYNGARGDVNE